MLIVEINLNNIRAYHIFVLSKLNDMEIVIKEIMQPVFGGCTSYDPSSRHKDLDEVISNMDIQNQWIRFGYNVFLFHRATGTVSIFRESK